MTEYGHWYPEVTGNYQMRTSILFFDSLKALIVRNLLSGLGLAHTQWPGTSAHEQINNTKDQSTSKVFVAQTFPKHFTSIGYSEK